MTGEIGLERHLSPIAARENVEANTLTGMVPVQDLAYASQPVTTLHKHLPDVTLRPNWDSVCTELSHANVSIRAEELDGHDEIVGAKMI